MRIRPAERKDLPALDTLSFELHRDLGRLVGREFTDEELEEERFVDADLPGIYVAEEADEIVAVIAFATKPAENEWVGKHYEIYHIYVKPAHQGRGIGTCLFELVRQRAIADDVNLTIGTLLANRDAIRFYRKLGFKPTSIGLTLALP